MTQDERDADDRLKIGVLNAISKAAEEGTTFVLVSVASGEIRKLKGDDWKLVRDDSKPAPLAGDA